MASDPDDAYQAVWEKVFVALGRFDPDGVASFATWLRTVTRRHLIDRHRRRTTRGEQVAIDGLSSAHDPERDTLRAQERARLRGALDQLPTGHRDVVVGHHLEGRSLRELAAAEGVALGTIKSRLHRGRALLAQILRKP